MKEAVYGLFWLFRLSGRTIRDAHLFSNDLLPVFIEQFHAAFCWRDMDVQAY
jgi:hypothetical protein